MNCQRARDHFAEFLTPSGTPHLPVDESGPARDARTHLAGCPDCQREFAALTATARLLDTMPAPQPSPDLRTNFYAMLDAEKRSAGATAATPARSLDRPVRPASVWRWVLSPLAAAALLMLGFTLGRRTEPVTVSSTPIQDDSTKRELVALREQMNRQHEQIENMTKLVSISILQQQQNPANQRLKDVLVAAREENPNNRILEDLILAVTLDPNANVRLRAIEALYPHAEREVVRAGMLTALPREQNPLVQLELIDFVAAAQVRSATPALERIAADESTNTTVRNAALLALAQF